MRSSMPNFAKSCLDLGDFGVAGSTLALPGCRGQTMPGRTMPNLQSHLALVSGSHKARLGNSRTGPDELQQSGRPTGGRQ